MDDILRERERERERKRVGGESQREREERARARERERENVHYENMTNYNVPCLSKMNHYVLSLSLSFPLSFSPLLIVVV
jgi:hypothetical protein